MPKIESNVTVDIDIETAFKLSQTYGEIRYMWDPFVKEQHLLNGATEAGVGVQTRTTSRHGISMTTQYTSYKAPNHVGMKMVEGPMFFKSFSGGWNFTKEGKSVIVTWRYNFVCKPKIFQPIMNFVGTKILQKDIDKRLQAFANACKNQDITKLL